jgi:hypothetical protein
MASRADVNKRAIVAQRYCSFEIREEKERLVMDEFSKREQRRWGKRSGSSLRMPIESGTSRRLLFSASPLGHQGFIETPNECSQNHRMYLLPVIWLSHPTRQAIVGCFYFWTTKTTVHQYSGAKLAVIYAVI